MSLLDKLNEEQRAAAECINGPVLIFAGAGSGKTRALTYRIAHMIDNCGISPDSILAVTFTNKAANEMKERINELIGEKAAKGMWMGTFHSVCARILRVDGHHVGVVPEYTIFGESDQTAIVKDIRARLEVTLPERERCADRKNNEILWAISDAKNQLMTVDDYRRTARGDWEKLVARVYSGYQRELGANNALDFDDLIMKTVQLLGEHEEVRRKYQERFQYVLVDEYQDINHAQFKLVEYISQEHRNICVVGDDDQSIYGWRGADVGIILDFQEHFSDARVVKLERNYRSSAKIIEAANSIIQQNENRAEKRLWTANPPGDNIVIYEAINEEEEAEWVANTIARQVTERIARYGDYAILYRVNAASRAFEQALAARRIPYQIVGGLRFFERAEIKDALAYLRALHNPADNLSVRRIINTPTRGIGNSTLEGITLVGERNNCSLMDACRYFAANEDESPRARTAVGNFWDMMKALRDRVEYAPLPDLVRAVVENSGMIDKYKETGKAEDAMRVENLQEFVTVAASFARRRPDAGLVDFLEHIALISDIDQADDMSGSVSLMTLHSAKGLEFPVVFMVSMEEGIFPHQRSIITGDSRELEEERRLAYVGMTRAEKLLHLSHAFQRTVYGETRGQTPSRFLRDLPDELLDRHQRYTPSTQPRILDTGDEVLERPSGGRKIDVASILQNARTGKSASAKPKPAKEQEKSAPAPWKTGEKVRHGKFGDGIVVFVEAAASDFKLTVAFANGGGVKKLLAGVANLQKL
ncbi:MAG: UvrD-helicase domain-containing protein [candidate division WS1 bacterium]|nr:UvrD-helicase domain-containing protein [candidate division WS1 bacterium]